jgi:AcrR family transcriptional regulator
MSVQSGTGFASRAKRPKKKTGPGRPTRQQVEERNVELLDKALDLFLEKGFEQATLNKITAAVGMAKRTVYARYGDKTMLFKAVLRRAIDAWIVPIERLRAAETEDVEESLLRLGHILVDNMMSPAGLKLMTITNSVSHRMPEIGEYTFHLGTESTLRYLADFFRRRFSRNGAELPNADEAAAAFLNLVVGGPARLTVWGMPQDKEAIERHTRYSVRLLLHGLMHTQSY